MSDPEEPSLEEKERLERDAYERLPEEVKQGILAKQQQQAAQEPAD